MVHSLKLYYQKPEFIYIYLFQHLANGYKTQSDQFKTLAQGQQPGSGEGRNAVLWVYSSKILHDACASVNEQIRFNYVPKLIL